MKYRIYRKITRIEYKDVEAKDEEEALSHRIDIEEGFKIISNGIISDSIVTSDLSKENHKIFIERDIENS